MIQSYLCTGTKLQFGLSTALCGNLGGKRKKKFLTSVDNLHGLLLSSGDKQAGNGDGCKDPVKAKTAYLQSHHSFKAKQAGTL